MNAHTQSLTLQGEAGAIEALLDRPGASQAARGLAVIAHPHPLFGGAMSNKVVQTLARAFVQCGWRALRFNFRGVGASAGTHDEGRGEARDMLAVISQAREGGEALAVAGFSFGAFVAAQAAASLAQAGDEPAALVLHGEADDTVPLAAVLDWARPQSLPVTVIPGGGHFFHGQLPLLKGLAARHLRSLA